MKEITLSTTVNIEGVEYTLEALVNALNNGEVGELPKEASPAAFKSARM